MPAAFRILVVDDDPTVITALGVMLRELGAVQFATSGRDALRLATQAPPDLVLLDIEMPGMSGFDVCSAMKEDPRLTDVPVILVTSDDRVEQEIAGLSLGAVDFIAKPPRAPLVVARARTQLRLKQMSDALRRAAHTDALTGVANRRLFDEILQREWLRARRSGAPLSLALVDVDFFKAYNDCYGHPAGDTCLKAVAEAIQAVARRPADLAARYGGEEFALLLPETDQDGAAAVAHRILQSIEDLDIRHERSGVAPRVTASIGVASTGPVPPAPALFDAHGRAAEHASPGSALALVVAADGALYSAKRSGRRQAQCALLDASETAVPVTQSTVIAREAHNAAGAR